MITFSTHHLSVLKGDNQLFINFSLSSVGPAVLDSIPTTVCPVKPKHLMPIHMSGHCDLFIYVFYFTEFYISYNRFDGMKTFITNAVVKDEVSVSTLEMSEFVGVTGGN